ncbi:hypothetical protein AsAng_0033590 [Aureispira anguillae]|uniref:Uncharacterized protein n=1 Tax=Aureispira anguillae TaxID=2864201 RepID=A0A915YGB1_9BACT|nr:hypothetical protein AsAng_0033590 [Aureispira anguillae]
MYNCDQSMYKRQQPTNKCRCYKTFSLYHLKLCNNFVFFVKKETKKSFIPQLA